MRNLIFILVLVESGKITSKEANGFLLRTKRNKSGWYGFEEYWYNNNMESLDITIIIKSSIYVRESSVS